MIFCWTSASPARQYSTCTEGYRWRNLPKTGSISFAGPAHQKATLPSFFAPSTNFASPANVGSGEAARSELAVTEMIAITARRNFIGLDKKLLRVAVIIGNAPSGPVGRSRSL